MLYEDSMAKKGGWGELYSMFAWLHFFFFLQIILSNVESVDQCRRIKTQVIQDAFTPFLSYFKHSCVPIYSMGELGMVSSIKQETSKYLFNK